MSSNYSTDEESTDDDAPAETLCYFHKSTLCTECKTTATLKEEIHRMQHSLACLFEQHRASLQKMNNVHDPLVSRLPVEVVSRIFSTFVPVHVDKCYGPICPEGVEEIPTTPLLLGAVCRTWRSIAWSTPKLWTSISLSVYKYYDGFGEVVREWLGRSGKLPLYIHLYTSPICTRDVYGRYHKPPDADLPYVAELLDAIIAYSDRWVYLDVHIPKSFMQHLQSGTRRLSMLSTLNLQIIVDCIPNSPKFEYEDKIEFGKIPNLRRICALNPNFHQIDNFSWKNLTHVEASTLTVEMCMELIHSAPLLTHLTIHKMFNSGDEYYPIIRHLSLISLEVMDFWLEDLLSSLNLPMLEHFGADIYGIDSTFSRARSIQALLERSSCSLKSCRFNLLFFRSEDTLDPQRFEYLIREVIPSSVDTLELSYEHSKPYHWEDPRKTTKGLVMSNKKLDYNVHLPPNLKHLRIMAKFHSWHCLLDLSGQPDYFPLGHPKNIDSMSMPQRTKSLQSTSLQIQPEDLDHLLDIEILQALQVVIESDFDVEPAKELQVKLSASFTRFLQGCLYQHKYYIDPPTPASHSHSFWY